MQDISKYTRLNSKLEIIRAVADLMHEANLEHGGVFTEDRAGAEAEGYECRESETKGCWRISRYMTELGHAETKIKYETGYVSHLMGMPANTAFYYSDYGRFYALAEQPENSNDKNAVADKISARLDNQAPRLPCDNACKNWAPYLEHRDSACVLSDVYSVRKGEPCTLHTGITPDVRRRARRYRKIKAWAFARRSLGDTDMKKVERIERMAWNKYGRLAGLTGEEAEIMDEFSDGLRPVGGPSYL